MGINSGFKGLMDLLTEYQVVVLPYNQKFTFKKTLLTT